MNIPRATCRHKIYTQNAIAISHFGAKALAEIKYIFRQKLRHNVHPLYIFLEKYTRRLSTEYNVCRYNSTVGESIFIYTKLWDDKDENLQGVSVRFLYFFFFFFVSRGRYTFWDI